MFLFKDFTCDMVAYIPPVCVRPGYGVIVYEVNVVSIAVVLCSLHCCISV